MIRTFRYLAAGYFTLATALNAFAADPIKVKSIADYVMDKGKTETISWGPYNGEGRTFEWPSALRGQKGELVYLIAQVITTSNVKVLFIIQSRYNRNDGRFWYVTMGDSARGQKLYGTLDFAETGINVPDPTNPKGNKIEFHRIDPADKVQWSSAESTFDSLVEIIDKIIPK